MQPHSTAPRPLQRLRRSAATALAAAALCLAWVDAAAAPLDDLRRQVEASQFEQAWATAQANPQLIGDVHFDFLYGMAAINTGRIPEGLLALERHLAAVPANDRARLELARGYFLLGEYTRARAEFDFVLRYNPPANVRATIAGFMQAMQTRELADNRASARLYAEAGLGYDDNVNGGTFRNDFLTTFGQIPLASTSSAQVGDTVVQLALGGQQFRRVSNRLTVFAGADLDHREGAEHKQYNLTYGNVYAGFTQLSGIALWRLTLSANELMVGGSRYRDTLQALLDATFTLDGRLTLQTLVMFAEQRHSTADQVRDARATSVGGTLTYNFADTPGAPQAGVRVLLTKDDNTRRREDLSRQVELLRVFGSLAPADKWRLTAGITGYVARYQAVDIGVGTQREDTAWGADLVLSYALTPLWSLRGELFYNEVRSNQDLYDSKRAAALLKVRYQF